MYTNSTTLKQNNMSTMTSSSITTTASNSNTNTTTTPIKATTENKSKIEETQEITTTTTTTTKNYDNCYARQTGTQEEYGRQQSLEWQTLHSCPNFSRSGFRPLWTQGKGHWNPRRPWPWIFPLQHSNHSAKGQGSSIASQSLSSRGPLARCRSQL